MYAIQQREVIFFLLKPGYFAIPTSIFELLKQWRYKQ